MMSDVKWIKIATNIFDNRKIRQIESLPDGDTIIVIWMKILCLAGIINDSGCIYLTKDIPYTEQMLASQFNRPLANIQMALKIFQQFEMIEVVDNLLMVSNWERYQNIEGLEKIREQRKEINARYYQKKKALELENKTSYKTSNKTQQDTIDIDKEIDIDIDKENNNTLCDIDFSELKEMEEFSKTLEEKKPKSSKFIPPTLEQVRAYAEARNRLDIADKFYEYYEAGDWKDVKGNKVKNWKQKFVTWESRNEVKKSYEAEKEMSGTPTDVSNLRRQLFGEE